MEGIGVATAGDRLTSRGAKASAMSRYLAFAAALKVADRVPDLYRSIGNKRGRAASGSKGVVASVADRADRLLTWCREHDIVTHGDNVLEIGTGWAHMDSMILRAAFDVDATLFDVWDNRQPISTLHAKAEQLGERIRPAVDDDSRVDWLVKTIGEAESYDDLYRELGFTYQVDGAGLPDVPFGSVKFVYSYNVMEHVKRRLMPDVLTRIHDVLEPGGYTSHEIDISDHLVSFAGVDLNKKYYMRFGPKSWKYLVGNDVQYINRFQASEWLEGFEQAGLDVIETERFDVDMTSVPISTQYRHYDDTDLTCFRIRVLARKPLT